jgi:hypothetical protein
LAFRIAELDGRIRCKEYEIAELKKLLALKKEMFEKDVVEKQPPVKNDKG